MYEPKDNSAAQDIYNRGTPSVNREYDAFKTSDCSLEVLSAASNHKNETSHRF